MIQFLIISIWIRFGSGVRTEKRDAKVPGAGTYHPKLIEEPKNKHPDMGKGERFQEGANKKQADGWPGPGEYLK